MKGSFWRKNVHNTGLLLQNNPGSTVNPLYTNNGYNDANTGRQMDTMTKFIMIIIWLLWTSAGNS